MTGWAFLLLILLEIKHFLFDFVFQTPYQIKSKGIYGHPGGILHSGLHVLGTAAALTVLSAPAGLFLAVLIGEFLMHYHVDWGKEQIMRRHGTTGDAFFWRLTGLDQLLHQLTYLAIAAILFCGMTN